MYLLAELAHLPLLSDIHKASKTRNVITFLPRMKVVRDGQNGKERVAFLYPLDDEYEVGKSMVGRRHRAYVTGEPGKDNEGLRPKQPLHILGLLRTNVQGLSDIREGRVEEERQDSRL